MCTAIRFSNADGNLVFGRNLDWSCGYGEQVLTVPRNYQRSWRHAKGESAGPAIIGMGILSENTPLFFDCANEHGLAVAGLNFPGWTQYENTPIPNKTNICAFELPFWIASTCKTVDEAEAALAHVAIIAEAPAPELGVALLHWMIVDKTRAIVLEYDKDGAHVYQNKLDVLTNQPGFMWHTENARNYLQVSPNNPPNTTWGTQELSAYGAGFGMHGLPGDFSSPSRFIRAAYLNAHYPTCKSESENVARLFHTLQGAAMVKGGAKMADGNFEFTVYTGGYSAESQTYFYTTYEDFTVRKVRLQESELDGATITVAP